MNALHAALLQRAVEDGRRRRAIAASRRSWISAGPSPRSSSVEASM